MEPVVVRAGGGDGALVAAGPRGQPGHGLGQLPGGRAGLAFLPLSALSLLGAGRLFPLLAARVGVQRTLVTGMAGLGAGTAALAAGMAVGGSYLALLPGMVWALFAGIAFPAFFRAAGAAVAPSEQGVAGGLVSTAQYVGGAAGLTALVTLSGLGRAAGPEAMVVALRTAGWAAAGLLLAGAAAAFALRTRGAPVTPVAGPPPASSAAARTPADG